MEGCPEYHAGGLNITPVQQIHHVMPPGFGRRRDMALLVHSVSDAVTVGLHSCQEVGKYKIPHAGGRERETESCRVLCCSVGCSVLVVVSCAVASCGVVRCAL